MASELETALIGAGYAAKDAATIDAAIAGVAGMFPIADADEQSLRLAALTVCEANALDAESIGVLARLYPVARAMMHRHFKTDEDGLDGMLQAGAIKVDRVLIIAWFGAILRSTIPASPGPPGRDQSTSAT